MRNETVFEAFSRLFKNKTERQVLGTILSDLAGMAGYIRTASDILIAAKQDENFLTPQEQLDLLTQISTHAEELLALREALFEYVSSGSTSSLDDVSE